MLLESNIARGSDPTVSTFQARPKVSSYTRYDTVVVAFQLIYQRSIKDFD